MPMERAAAEIKPCSSIASSSRRYCPPGITMPRIPLRCTTLPVLAALALLASASGAAASDAKPLRIDDLLPDEAKQRANV